MNVTDFKISSRKREVFTVVGYKDHIFSHVFGNYVKRLPATNAKAVALAYRIVGGAVMRADCLASPLEYYFARLRRNVLLQEVFDADFTNKTNPL